MTEPSPVINAGNLQRWRCIGSAGTQSRSTWTPRLRLTGWRPWWCRRRGCGDRRGVCRGRRRPGPGHCRGSLGGGWNSNVRQQLRRNGSDNSSTSHVLKILDFVRSKELLPRHRLLDEVADGLVDLTLLLSGRKSPIPFSLWNKSKKNVRCDVTTISIQLP